MMSLAHKFSESLARSKAQQGAGWWEETYRKAFPTLISCVPITADGYGQRSGIDRVITLACSRRITVDEKVRYTDYGDVLLEFLSDRDRKTPGWICKPLACDFIAYAIVPKKTCYLFETLSLQRAWEQNHKTWFQHADEREHGFKYCSAKNNGYWTDSLIIPTETLFNALVNSMIISWKNDA